jgi:hypothetical protein
LELSPVFSLQHPCLFSLLLVQHPLRLFSLLLVGHIWSDSFKTRNTVKLKPIISSMPAPEFPPTPPLTPDTQVAVLARPIDDENKNSARVILEQAARSDHFREANYNGSIFVGNNQGLSIARDQSTLQTEVLSLKRELREFKDQSAKNLDQNVSNLRRQELLNQLLYERITGLESSTVPVTDIRNRFLSVYKRDNIGREFLTENDRKCIETGNQTAHGGNARMDSSLYHSQSGKPPIRTDIETFVKLYGVHPGIVPLTGKSQ